LLVVVVVHLVLLDLAVGVVRVVTDVQLWEKTLADYQLPKAS
jgi:hypothetical protein